jgi:signal transduction histidine kinase
VDGDDVRASRARIASSASAARRAHERALHDGVQQDLIAASVRLQFARELLTTDPAAAAALLDELRDDLHAALDRVRGVADDIYPSVLDVRGLPVALRHALRIAAVDARLDADGVGRYPDAIEAAVYFCCRALLSETTTAVSLREDGRRLSLELYGAVPNDEARDLAEAAGGALAAEPGCVIATFPRDTESRP